MSGHLKPHSALIITIGVSTAALSLVLWCYKRYKIKKLQIPPKNWKYIGKLEEITLYPIKSCCGIDLDQVECTVLGLKHEVFIDRNFALLNSTGGVVTGRNYPKLVKIKTKIQKNSIIVTAPEMTDLEIHMDEIQKNDIQETSIWGSNVMVTKCGRKYDEWFSKYILDKNDGLVLVYYKFNEPTKPIMEKLKNDTFLNVDAGCLHDVSSYLLMNSKSIEDLNTRLIDKIHHKQLRPNFLIKTTGPAYDEDNWNWIKIGNNVIFRAVVPNYRCVFTNINPFTGERHPDGEPLKTLKTYRVWEKYPSPRFGIQLGIRNTGIIKKNDDVFVEA